MLTQKIPMISMLSRKRKRNQLTESLAVAIILCVFTACAHGVLVAIANRVAI